MFNNLQINKEGVKYWFLISGIAMSFVAILLLGASWYVTTDVATESSSERIDLDTKIKEGTDRSGLHETSPAPSNPPSVKQFDASMESDISTDIPLPTGYSDITVLDRWDRTKPYQIWNGPFDAYDLLLGFSDGSPREMINITLLEYRDTIKVEYGPYADSVEQFNLQELRDLLDTSDVGHYKGENGSASEIIYSTANERKVRRYLVHERAQTGCIPSNLIYEFFENDLYIGLVKRKESCNDLVLSDSLMEKIVDDLIFK